MVLVPPSPPTQTNTQECLLRYLLLFSTRLTHNSVDINDVKFFHVHIGPSSEAIRTFSMCVCVCVLLGYGATTFRTCVLFFCHCTVDIAFIFKRRQISSVLRPSSNDGVRWGVVWCNTACVIFLLIVVNLVNW